MWYNPDFNKLGLQNQLLALRNATINGYQKAILFPLSELLVKWQNTRKENLIILSYNSQTCYLRKMLNDKFDPGLRRIVIDDSPEKEQPFIYTWAENSDVFGDEDGIIYLDQDFEYDGSDVDFIVRAPAEVKAARLNEMTAQLNFYKLIGMSFQIVEL